MSVINFAIRELEVKHVVICGHYGCGGIKAAMQSRDLGILNPWLRSIRDVYRLHNDTLSKIENEDDRYKKLVELNIQEQCVNLMKTAAAQKAYRASKLKVHGWVFNMENGKLIDLQLDFDKILSEIMQIYHLD